MGENRKETLLYVLLSRRAYRQCNFEKAATYARRAYALSPDEDDLLINLTTCLLALATNLARPDEKSLLATNACSELFALSQDMLSEGDSPTSWLVGGAYYYATGKYEQAKELLIKCSNIAAGEFPSCWMLLGHTFAAGREHDLAMSCYLRASKCLTMAFEPHIYLANEYAMTNNLSLAEKFLEEAARLSNKEFVENKAPDEDTWKTEEPVILHSLGVLYYKLGRLQNAYDVLKRAWYCSIQGALSHGSKYEKSTEPLQHAWQRMMEEVYTRASIPVCQYSLLHNIASVCRKIGKYEEAIEFHNRCMHLRSPSVALYNARAICYLNLNRWALAYQDLHAALSIEPDNQMSLKLLQQVTTIMATHPWLWEEPHKQVAHALQSESQTSTSAMSDDAQERKENTPVDIPSHKRHHSGLKKGAHSPLAKVDDNSGDDKDDEPNQYWLRTSVPSDTSNDQENIGENVDPYHNVARKLEARVKKPQALIDDQQATSSSAHFRVVQPTIVAPDLNRTIEDVDMSM